MKLASVLVALLVSCAPALRLGGVPVVVRRAAGAAVATAAVAGAPLSAFADGQTDKFKLPPIDTRDAGRCAFKSSSMGQANGAKDKLFDYRLCDMSGKKADGFDIAGAILADADFTRASFRETVVSKAYARGSKFAGADFTNGVIDRVSFDGSDMKGAIFTNAVLTGTSFDGANLEDADFSDAFIGDFELRKICKNPTLKGENPVTGSPTRGSAGCGG